MAEKFSIALLSMVLVAFCSPSREQMQTPGRDTIAVMYVASDELPVRERPAEDSPVVATYQRGEAVSVFGREGEWTELRVGIERSGWAFSSALAESKSEIDGDEGSDIARFRVAPSPVYLPGAKGLLVLEAHVSTDGNVFEVRTITNTTGSPDVERLNREELLRAKFHPLVVHGARQPFVYEHRVEY
ncbi:MAG TPA: SH3 domain-containing protein [Thermoanaerobaculia bacterium]|nr:SH3 domain-containing protein [Thermoanaerobaculia bacterium]